MKSNCETQKIQESISNSWKEEDERVIQGNWTSDLPFLWLYTAFRHSLHVHFMSRQEKNLMEVSLVCSQTDQ